MEEKDLTLPENNDFIPREDGQDISEDLAQNELVRAEDKPPIGKYILKKLGTTESCGIGDIIINRRFKNAEGETGGEEFSVANRAGKEIRLTLAQLASIATQQQLEDLLEE